MNLWFTARGAGLSALVLLTVSTCVGALMSRPALRSGRLATTSSPRTLHSGREGSASTRYVIQYVHRVAAAMGISVLMLHIGTILADSYAGVGWRGALIPFTSGYRPTWVALGSLAAYTFVAVTILGLARGRMAGSPRGARVWRRLHGLAYVGWASAMVHGFNAGTDTSVPWVRALYAASLVAVVTSVVVRIVQVRRTSANHVAHVEKATPVLQGAHR